MGVPGYSSDRLHFIFHRIRKRCGPGTGLRPIGARSRMSRRCPCRHQYLRQCAERDPCRPGCTSPENDHHRHDGRIRRNTEGNGRSLHCGARPQHARYPGVSFADIPLHILDAGGGIRRSNHLQACFQPPHRCALSLGSSRGTTGRSDDSGNDHGTKTTRTQPSSLFLNARRVLQEHSVGHEKGGIASTLRVPNPAMCTGRRRISRRHLEGAFHLENGGDSRKQSRRRRESCLPSGLRYAGTLSHWGRSRMDAPE